jgi:hypothetical protein
MKRRNFILLAGGALTVVAIPTANHFFGKVDYPPALALPGSLTSIMDSKELKELGVAYRSLIPDESRERIVTKRLMEKLSDDNAFITSLEEVIKKDFAAGNTIEVKGWILSKTEARQCALYSFSTAPSQ